MFVFLQIYRPTSTWNGTKHTVFYPQVIPTVCRTWWTTQIPTCQTTRRPRRPSAPPPPLSHPPPARCSHQSSVPDNRCPRLASQGLRESRTRCGMTRIFQRVRPPVTYRINLPKSQLFCLKHLVEIVAVPYLGPAYNGFGGFYWHNLMSFSIVCGEIQLCYNSKNPD